MTAPDPAPETAALVDRARLGDQRAFEALYRETSGQVYGLCLRLTGNPPLAEECVQQTYVQAWRKLAAFRGDSSLATWLHRIAVNEVRAQFRRESRHPALPEMPEPAELPAVGSADPGPAMDLEKAIAALPERARSVFVLVGVYGYPHEEAASMLGIAAGTSKAHYHHARKQLMTLLGDAS